MRLYAISNLLPLQIKHSFHGFLYWAGVILGLYTQSESYCEEKAFIKWFVCWIILFMSILILNKKAVESVIL